MDLLKTQRFPKSLGFNIEKILLLLRSGTNHPELASWEVTVRLKYDRLEPIHLIKGNRSKGYKRHRLKQQGLVQRIEKPPKETITDPTKMLQASR